MPKSATSKRVHRPSNWRLGRENVFAIGQYRNDRSEGRVPLDDARQARDKARALLKKGIHPAHNRQTERLATNVVAADTFKTIGKEWMVAKSSRWTDGYKSQVKRVLEADVFPVMGHLPIRTVTAAFVKALEKHYGDPATITGLRLLLLTFVRSTGLRHAQWREIDLEKAKWLEERRAVMQQWADMVDASARSAIPGSTTNTQENF